MITVYEIHEFNIIALDRCEIAFTKWNKQKRLTASEKDELLICSRITKAKLGK